jgi:hypothetical protein
MPNRGHMTKVVLTLIGLLLCSCAGPTSPFGSPSLWSESLPKYIGVSTINQVKIKFYPKSQILHGQADFTVTIEDPQGIGPDARVRLFYNSLDVTSKFLSQARKTYLDSEHTKLQYSVSNVRILPLRENKIYFGYMRNLDAKPVVAKYEPPHCSLFQTEKLASTHEFELPPNLKNMLQDFSANEKINPNYMAGLVAQESSFDSKAVSWDKAIGLTQITPLGEAEIFTSEMKWPRYPGINGMSPGTLKILVSRGRINSKNEWRLDPALSIKGGLAYIKYLNGYWSKPENRNKLNSIYSDPDREVSSVILASYNSGPARVSQAMQKYGDRWLSDSPELDEAKLYVKRVTSYCDYFSQGEEVP